ncbi:hypothetical protein Bhyg_03068 [Pseudolycoriella hygida]|uniref:Uncharacterized protein n=1 Tax=Pseudolycoriella hygida TaxID=35572 RepID=A0A9Q0S969_9DIPT|nr:hypothetical protein Bhyg_03068 [Pseudolycoriella hygida]
MVRKILPNERCKVTSRTTQNSKHSAQANSAAATTSAERNKKLEMGWKY